MDVESGRRPQPGSMHRASVLMRRILVLNHEIELLVGKELAVNQTDFDAMQHLLMGGPLSPGDLARRLHITTAAATVMIDRLVKVGHVTRQPHPTDRRRLLVVPTPESALRAMDSIMPMIRETDSLLQNYSPVVQEAITDYLARTVEIMERRLLQDQDVGRQGDPG